MVDIIILNWNGRCHLEHCLPALQNQTYKEKNVIVVNNGSSDDSYVWLKNNYPWVKVVELKENIGFTGGNIAGYKVSEAKYVVLLNNDTLPEPQWLESLVRSAETRPDVGIIASVMLQWGSRIIDTAGDSCTFAGNGFKMSEGLNLDNITSGYIFGACAGAALYKREMLDQIGFLDPDFFLNHEDIDLSFRAQLAGWKVWLDHEARVHHRVHATTGRISPQIVFYASRNIEFTFWKNMPNGLLLRALPHKLFQLLISFYFTGIKNRRIIPFVRGKLAALKCLPMIMSKRKMVQSTRSVTNQYVAKILTPVIGFEYVAKRFRIVKKVRI